MQSNVKQDLAYLTYQDVLYYSQSVRSTFEPSSAVVSLIQGVYECFPENALKILRNRIYTNFEPTLMCKGMVKVAAKRLSIGSAVDGCLDQIKDGSRVQRIEYSGKTLSGPHRNIEAHLVLEDGSVVLSTSNSNGINRTLHAEVNLVQKWWKLTNSAIPKGASLYVTMKPCKMCAAMIRTCAEDIQTNSIIYQHDDLGPMASHTALDGWYKGATGTPFLGQARVSIRHQAARLSPKESFWPQK